MASPARRAVRRSQTKNRVARARRRRLIERALRLE